MIMRSCIFNKKIGLQEQPQTYCSSIAQAFDIHTPASENGMITKPTNASGLTSGMAAFLPFLESNHRSSIAPISPDAPAGFTVPS
jgi:hypothetical protein